MSECKHTWYLSRPTHIQGVTGPDDVIVTVKCAECGAIGDAEDVTEQFGAMQDTIDELRADLEQRDAWATAWKATAKGLRRDFISMYKAYKGKFTKLEIKLRAERDALRAEGD